MLRNILLFLSVAGLHACSSDASFSGSSSASKPVTQASPKPLAEPEPVVEKKPVVPAPAPAPAPPTAQRKGSFQIFATPSNPAPGQSYKITIYVDLGDIDPNKFARSDLSGTVDGTDGFSYRVGSNQSSVVPGSELAMMFKKIMSSTPPENFVVEEFNVDVPSRRAILTVQIPGASQHVKDTVVISSKLLSEEQTFDLVFGS